MSHIQDYKSIAKEIVEKVQKDPNMSVQLQSCFSGKTDDAGHLVSAITILDVWENRLKEQSLDYEKNAMAFLNSFRTTGEELIKNLKSELFEIVAQKFKK